MLANHEFDPEGFKSYLKSRPKSLNARYIDSLVATAESLQQGKGLIYPNCGTLFLPNEPFTEMDTDFYRKMEEAIAFEDEVKRDLSGGNIAKKPLMKLIEYQTNYFDQLSIKTSPSTDNEKMDGVFAV